MTETENKPHRRLRSRLLLALVLCAALAGSFFLGSVWAGYETEPVITGDLLGERLGEVQELVSVEYYYTNMGRFENQLDFYGWKVPFTTKSFIISYDGVIKAGVDLSQAQVTVSETMRTVTVTLPASAVISHEIPEGSIQVFDESRNLFNPITIDDYVGFTRDQKTLMEQRAIDNGLLTAASEKARAAVKSLLCLMPGMEAYALTVR